MKTDIYCEIQCREHEVVHAQKLLDEAFQHFRDFSDRYSRFRQDNELWKFNESTGHHISPELFSLLEKSLQFAASTQGYFDPSVLPSLEKEGYHGAYAHSTEHHFSWQNLTLHPASCSFEKPLDLKFDFGGIGKGFIVDTIATFFGQQFQNFLIDAGGDICVRGKNRVNAYDFWAIDIEDPFDREQAIATLLLRDQAIATSGSNRRKWEHQGRIKHHLINPHTQQSAESDFVSVTVIAPDTVTADIWAKTLFIAGRQQAIAFAEKHSLPFFAVTTNHQIVTNSLMQSYVWQQQA